MPFYDPVIRRLRDINTNSLAVLYTLAYGFIELHVQNPIRYYIFSVFLSLSGIYFSWFLGGRRTMFFVAFFNLFIIFIFSKLLWQLNMVVSPRLLLGKSFMFIYLLAVIFMFLMIFRKSPADAKRERQDCAVQEARQNQENLEFMVASKKLKMDLLTQANRVKDELQLLEGAWKSNIHDIINDLPEVKERELYSRIVLPFQENIINHLRKLDQQLTFDVMPVSPAELKEFVLSRLDGEKQAGTFKLKVEIEDSGWQDHLGTVRVDRNKFWDIIHNILRNSQTAIDFKRLDLLRQGGAMDFAPLIRMEFSMEKNDAVVRIYDNGGGADSIEVAMLYNQPVMSRKRSGKKAGQGSLFVKFFADRMGIGVHAENTTKLGEKGLAVTIRIPPESEVLQLL